MKSNVLDFLPNEGLDSLGHFGRDGHPVGGAGMLSGLGEDFLVSGGMNLGIAVEADVAAFERFHEDSVGG